MKLRNVILLLLLIINTLYAYGSDKMFFNSNNTVLKITDDSKDAADFGIVYNTGLSQTKKIQAAIYDCAQLKLKLKISGIITVDEQLSVPSDTYMFSENKGGFEYIGKEQFFCITIPGSNNITFKGIYSSHKNSNVHCFLYCHQSSNVLIDSCISTMSIIHADSKNAGQVYADLIDYTLTHNITVRNCTATGIGIQHGIAAILIEYAQNVHIENNSITNFKNGIQWWGGDSNHLKDGAITNDRRCKNIMVINNMVKNADAGIWGSMGDNIKVVNNRVSDCQDVGIDFEGCFNGVADSNYVTNAKNGNLATFFLNRNITFSNNIVISDRNDTTYIARIYNESQTADNDNIQFINNTFIGNIPGSICFMVIDPNNFLQLRDNIFINTKIHTSGINHGNMDIEGNSFVFNLQTHADSSAIIKIDGMTYSRNIIIKNNTIKKSNTLLAPGIILNSDDNSGYNFFDVQNNLFQGFNHNQTCIYAFGKSDNTETQPYFKIKNNILNDGQIIKDPNSTGRINISKNK